MKLNCLRCGYEWITRLETQTPKQCPACKSYRYAEPKREKKEKGEGK